MIEKSKIKVVICDDHTLFREGLKASLTPYDDLEIIGEAGDGAQLIQLLKHMNPDVILLDINMPVMDGIETLPRIKKEYPDKKVIIVSMHNNVSMISKMIALGANSYLTKGDSPEIIHAAINGVYTEDVYFTPLMSRVLLKITQENDTLKNMEVSVRSTDSQPKVVKEKPQTPPDPNIILERIVNKLDELETRSQDKSTMLHWDKPEEVEAKSNYWSFVKKGIFAGLIAAAFILILWYVSKTLNEPTKTAVNTPTNIEHEYGQAFTFPIFEMEGSIFR
jgi:DNA-binding NarL/FixJ family response regulator